MIDLHSGSSVESKESAEDPLNAWLSQEEYPWPIEQWDMWAEARLAGLLDLLKSLNHYDCNRLRLLRTFELDDFGVVHCSKSSQKVCSR